MPWPTGSLQVCFKPSFHLSMFASRELAAINKYAGLFIAMYMRLTAMLNIFSFPIYQEYTHADLLAWDLCSLEWCSICTVTIFLSPSTILINLLCLGYTAILCNIHSSFNENIDIQEYFMIESSTTIFLQLANPLFRLRKNGFHEQSTAQWCPCAE